MMRKGLPTTTRWSKTTRAVAMALLAGVVVGIASMSVGCTSTSDRTAPSNAPKLTQAERIQGQRAAARERARARVAARRARLRAALARQAAAERAQVPATTTSFVGAYFGIDYPDDWVVVSREESRGGYLDTTIRSALDPNKMLRVDVQPDASSVDLEGRAQHLVSNLASQPGYRQLSFSSSPFQGYDAFRWEFLVTEHGVLLHKVDWLFNDDLGDSFAVLTQAPARSYRYWTDLFRNLGQSFVTADAVPPGAATSSGTDFCSTYACIDNFDSGIGYIVQCADGMWSHSGGRPGACSYHGGETNNTYSGASSPSNEPNYGTPSGGADLGPGNGSTVVCADGSISHSGGIQGACSHHGGVGP
jgi:hypothetical protein